jgi:signal transduction histidine kinase
VQERFKINDSDKGVPLGSTVSLIFLPVRYNDFITNLPMPASPSIPVDDPTPASRAHLHEGRIEWADVQLTRVFFANSRTSISAVVVALPVTVSLLWDYVNIVWLLLWAAGVVVLAGYRYWIVQTYTRNLSNASAAAINKFFDKHHWCWPASALQWAALMFLYFDKVPVVNQFICMLILVGMASFAVALMSSRLRCYLEYVVSMTATCFLAVLVSMVTASTRHWQPDFIAMPILIVAFGWLLANTGKRFHAVQRRGYELQYDNEGLIASLREQTETAMQAVKVKNGLLANAAHDLRQPVHALAFYADWLRNEPEMATEVLPKILQATDSVNTLFNSLFDFAKIEAGGVQPQFSAVPVCEIVNDLVLQFSPEADSKKIEFRQRITPALVWTDAVLIRRIISNLVANAVRYTDHGGVLIATRLRGGRMHIQVWDTGVGIALEHQPQVFTEFYKAPVHAGTEDGFGLGLAIVERLSSVLGHQVHLNSRLGKGTRMWVELDLALGHTPIVLPAPANPLVLDQPPLPEATPASSLNNTVGSSPVGGLGAAFHVEAAEQTP